MPSGAFVPLVLARLTSVSLSSIHTPVFSTFREEVTGQEHRDMQQYIVVVVANAVPKDFLVAIRALADFQYIAQVPKISDRGITMINNALQEFHNHKDSIISAGV